MATTDYLPHYPSGAPFTRTTGADVTGGRLVAVNASGLVVPTVSDDPAVIGVAAYDAPASSLVLVYPRPGGVHRLIAAAPITAGTKVTAAADGKVAPLGAGSNPVGIALISVAAAAVVDVAFI